MQMAENMARPASASQEVYPDHIAAARMYKGVVESLADV